MLRASAGSIKLTSIYGNAQSEKGSALGSPASQPYSHLLEIDGTRILLDCGWNASFDVSYLEKLQPYLPAVDGVLLSTPELCSCGALPYVLEHLKPGAFVFAPVSTSKVGIHGLLHPFLYQFPNTHDFRVRRGVGEGGEDLYETFTLNVNKIYTAFRSVNEPFGRDVLVSHKDVTVKCTAVFTGRMLGGHGWVIKYQIDELFYCPDYSLKPSYALKRFVAPTTSNLVCLGAFPFQARPSLAGVTGGGAPTTSKLEDQLQQLFKDIQHTLRGGSDVLLPTNVPGRGLEILSTVVHLLQEHGGDKYKVVLASLQAQELMDKAATITEALQDEVMLGDRALFTNVIACRTADEVLMITGPKVCVADGASLDYGIAAELLPHFLSVNAMQGGSNLIVLSEVPTPGTNAYHIAQTPQKHSISYTFAKRSRLSKEELEEFYVQQEREVEAARQRLLQAGTFDLERNALDGDVSDAEGNEDDDDEEGNEGNAEGDVGDVGADDRGGAAPAQAGEAGVTASTAFGRAGNTPGLVLPSYLHYHSKHLSFPVLDASSTLAAAVMDRLDVVYGLPVSDEEQMVMRRVAPNRDRAEEDEGPEALRLRNDAQMEANVPSKVTKVAHTQERHCKVLFTDLSGYADAAAVRGLIKAKFTFAKKLVCIRGGVDCWRPLAQFCRSEKSLKCGENVLMLRGPSVPLELATQVLSYIVQLEPALAQQLPQSMKRVRETSSQGAWDVGWVNGELRGASQSEAQQEQRRLRQEEEGASSTTATAAALTLSSVQGPKLQQCAEEREAYGLSGGSFFVGNIELIRLKDRTRREGGLHSEFQRKAPMLVFEDGVAVRKGVRGTITVASVASPAMYDIRQSVYGQFSQVL